MLEFDAEAFVARLERMGLKLTCVPLADGKVRINRWRMLNAGEHTQQIQDLWASQIGEDQARIDVLAAHLSRVAPPVTSNRISFGRAGTVSPSTDAPQTPAVPAAVPRPQTHIAPPVAPKPANVPTAAASPKVAAVPQPATAPQRAPERTFDAQKLTGVQKLPGVSAVPGVAPSAPRGSGLQPVPGSQKTTELRPAAGLPRPATTSAAPAPSKPSSQAAAGASEACRHAGGAAETSILQSVQPARRSRRASVGRQPFRGRPLLRLPSCRRGPSVNRSHRVY